MQWNAVMVHSQRRVDIMALLLLRSESQREGNHEWPDNVVEKEDAKYERRRIDEKLIQWGNGKRLNMLGNQPGRSYGEFGKSPGNRLKTMRESKNSSNRWEYRGSSDFFSPLPVALHCPPQRPCQTMPFISSTLYSFIPKFEWMEVHPYYRIVLRSLHNVSVCFILLST